MYTDMPVSVGMSVETYCPEQVLEITEMMATDFHELSPSCPIQEWDPSSSLLSFGEMCSPGQGGNGFSRLVRRE